MTDAHLNDEGSIIVNVVFIILLIIIYKRLK